MAVPTTQARSPGRYRKFALALSLIAFLGACATPNPPQITAEATTTSVPVPQRLAWGEKSTVGGMDITVAAPANTGKALTKWEQTPELHEVPDLLLREVAVMITVSNSWPSVGRVTVHSDTVDNASALNEDKIHDLYPGETATQVVLLQVPVAPSQLELTFGSTWRDTGEHKDRVSYKGPIA